MEQIIAEPYDNSAKYDVKTTKGQCANVDQKVCIEIDKGKTKLCPVFALWWERQ